MHDEVEALTLDLEVVVRDERGNLDDDVTRRLESGHLEVHPHQQRGDPTIPRSCPTYRSFGSTRKSRCPRTRIPATPVPISCRRRRSRSLRGEDALLSVPASPSPFPTGTPASCCP